MPDRAIVSPVKPALGVRIAALALLASAPFVHAQEWPTKPVKLIVPFPPGGGTEAFARPLAAVLSKQLGQQFIIDSRGGAGGNIGADLAAKSAADGYTFLLGAVHHTVAVSVYKNLPYDLERDLVPVTGVGYVPDVLVVNDKMPAKSIRELIACSKGDPEKVSYVFSGNGTTRQLAGEIFNSLTGTSMIQKNYPTREAADRFTDEAVARTAAGLDANDMLYAVSALRNYDPSSTLERIRAKVMHINSADDFINPPELGIAEREIRRVRNGRFVLLPASEETFGHGTHTRAGIWKKSLWELLDGSQR